MTPAGRGDAAGEQSARTVGVGFDDLEATVRRRHQIQPTQMDRGDTRTAVGREVGRERWWQGHRLTDPRLPTVGAHDRLHAPDVGPGEPLKTRSPRASEKDRRSHRRRLPPGSNELAVDTPLQAPTRIAQRMLGNPSVEDRVEPGPFPSRRRPRRLDSEAHGEGLLLGRSVSALTERRVA